MPVINGVYLKDFPALPSSVADANIIPIAISGNQIAYRTTVAGIVTDARITSKLLTGLSVTGGAVVAADTILAAFGKVQNQINGKQGTITLTTTGTSGASTLVGNTLNVPNYADGGVLSLTAIGGTANANAATITGTVLNLQPADASFGGVVTTGTQTFAGAKTVSSTLASTFVGQFFENTGASTSAKLIRISNTSGDLALGLEGATPTEIPIAEGGIAYAAVLKSVGSNSLILGTLSKAALTINTSQQVTLAQGLTGTTANFTGQLTLGSTITNGTYTYTLPSATGTLALVGGAGVGTVTSVAALTLGTSGTDLSSTVANGTTTPVITLNVPDASATARGVITTGSQTIAGDKTLTGTLYGIGLSMTGTTADIVQGTATSGKALLGTATTGWGLYASATTGVGVQGNSSGTGGSGVFGSSGDGYGGIFYNDSTTYAALEVNNNNESGDNIAVFRRVGTSVFIINGLGNISNGTYTYTLPSATGTLALTSALSSYLPLSGGTLTGALSGTSATFSSTATATAFIPSGATVPTNGMYLSAANTLNFATNTTNRLTIASTGAATFSSGISVGGATATTGGIQFPATQVAIASANNLDDYEEGTWTPGLKFAASTVGITYSAQSGTYTKIGRQVTVNGYFSLSNKGAAAGQAVITGLPFTIANTTGNYAPSSLRINVITYTGLIQALGNINDTTLGMEQVTEAGVLTDITNTNFANTSSVIISFTYFV